MPRTEFEARGMHVRLPAEVRADDDGLRVEGYAAVFNEDADIAGLFIERIAPGAFTEAIGRDEVVFLFNHDDDTVMARTSAGNLTLSEDEHGLKVSALLSEEDPDVQRLSAKMRAGNINKMSFAFYAEDQRWDETQDPPVRTIHKARLHDVSAVTSPAYDGTEIGLRSLEEARRQTRKKNFSAARLRMRLKRDLAVRENG